MFQTTSQVLHNPVIEQFASSFGGYSLMQKKPCDARHVSDEG
jgi:hypothetical protein